MLKIGVAIALRILLLVAFYFLLEWILRALPWDLRRPSLVIGFPLFNDFDIRRLFITQYLLLCLPAAGALAAAWRWGVPSPLPVGTNTRWKQAAWIIGLLCISVSPPARLLTDDLFHMGERVVPPSLVLEGWMPWRDFFFVHGLSEDILQGLPGMALWGPNAWSVLAFGAAIWLPVGVALYAAFYARVLPANPVWLLLVFLCLVMPPRVIGGLVYQQRFFLSPATLLACLAFFRNPSPARAIVFSFFSVLALFLSAEYLFFDLAFALAVLFADVQSADTFRAPFKKFHRTLKYGGFSILWILLGFAVLYAGGALEPYILFHLKSAQDHLFSGGYPFSGIDQAWLWTQRLCIAAGLWMAADVFRSKRKLSPEELTIGAVWIFSIFYFQKILGRADKPHFIAAWAPCLPLFFFVAGRWVTRIDLRLRTWSTRLAYPLSTLLLVAVAATQVPRWLEGLPARYSLPEKKEVVGERAQTAIADWQRHFQGRPAQIFDFTNQPMLFHYFLGLKPATRFPYTSVAIHPDIQAWVIEDLVQRAPDEVVLASTRSALFKWDEISNFVRHQHISRFLLSHYEPQKWIADSLLAAKRPLGAAAHPKAWQPFLKQLGHCHWGHVPGYLSALNTSPVKALLATEKADTDWKITLPTSLANQGGQLELQWKSARGGKVEILLPGSESNITANLSPRPMLIPVESCPQWYGREGETFRVRAPKDAVLTSAAWTP